MHTLSLPKNRSTGNLHLSADPPERSRYRMSFGSSSAGIMDHDPITRFVPARRRVLTQDLCHCSSLLFADRASDQTICYYRPRAWPGTLWPAPHTTAAPSFSSADPAQLKCLFTQPFSRHAYPVYLHDRHVEQLQYYSVFGTAHVSQLFRRLVAVSLRVLALLLLRASVGRLFTQPPECPEAFPGVYERPHGSVHDLDASRPR